VYSDTGIGVSASGQFIVLLHRSQEPEFWWRYGSGAATRPLGTPPAETVAVRPDGKQFLLGYKNGFQVWNRDRSPASDVLWHSGPPRWPTWSADGRWFAAASASGLVRVWRSNEQGPLRASLPMPITDVLPLVFSLSLKGDRVVTAGQDQGQALFRVYRLRDGEAEGKLVSLPGLPTGAALSPDGKTVYALTLTNGRGQLHAFDLESGQPVYPTVDLTFSAFDVACRPDGGALALAGGNGDVELRYAATGQLIAHQKSSGPWAETSYVADRIRFARDGRTFFTCGRQQTVFQWDARDGSLVQQFTSAADRRPVDARPSPDGRYLVTASLMSREALVWDAHTGKPAAPPLSHPDAVFAARFDPESNRVVTACRDGKTRVWDWRSGQLSIPPLAQVEEVTDAAFSPDGRWIASAEAGGTVRVWDARTGLPLAPGWRLQSPKRIAPYYANRLEFTADGRHLLVGVREQRLLVFDLTSLAASSELTPDDAVLLAEINAGKALLPGGSIEPLSTGQWFERWQQFQQRHPDFHALPD
jgi:WD40 repeat protein